MTTSVRTTASTGADGRERHRGAPGARASEALSGLLARAGASERTSATVLLAATAVALVWANVPGAGYDAFWHTSAGLGAGGLQLELDLRHWVNDALMTLFFFLVTLEVKRDLVLGELRDVRRVRVPVVGAVAGLVVPAALFVALTTLTGQPEQVRAAWGVVISTDTAFVLGLVAALGTALPVNVRAFVLTLAVVDDVAALGVIAVRYSGGIDVAALLLAAAGLGVIALLRWSSVWRGSAYLLVAVPVWLAVLASGVHPTVAGVAVALLLPVHRAVATQVDDVDRAVREYRQSPTSDRGRLAVLRLTRSVSVNERLQRSLRGWVALVVLPVFALANAGVVLTGEALREAATSGLTWAVVVALVGGKAVGITAAALLAVRSGLGTLPSGVAARHVAVAGLLSGMGFTISLFIVDLAITDEALAAQARLGVLAATVLSAALGASAAALVRVLDRSRLPGRQRLVRAVDPRRDHVRGRVGAPLELVLYTSFAYSTVGRAGEVVDELRAELGEELVVVVRHLPGDHPQARAAAEASEEAAQQRRFWELYDRLTARGGRLDARELRRSVVDAGLNRARVDDALGEGRHAERVEEDVRDAAAMGLEEAPVLFVGGELYDGPLEVAPVRSALERTAGRGARTAQPLPAPRGLAGGHHRARLARAARRFRNRTGPGPEPAAERVPRGRPPAETGARPLVDLHR